MLDKKVLYTRASTAIIFAAVVIFLLNYSRLTIFIFLSIVAFFTAYEYVKIKLKDNAGFREKYIAPLLFGVAPVAIDFFTPKLNFVGFIILLIITILFDIYLMFKLFYNKSMVVKSDIAVYFEILFYIGIPILLASNLLLSNMESKSILFFIVILLIWANDTFAYLTGSMLGKHKLMPSVSPGKTIEGFVGGGVFTIITAVLLNHFINVFPLSYYILLGLIVWIIGTIGDLVESKLKRSYNIKDSGTIMPGHGGFLDRFDSFIFVLPFLVLLTYFYL